MHFETEGLPDESGLHASQILIDNQAIYHKGKLHKLRRSLIKEVKVELSLFMIQQELESDAAHIKEVFL